MEQKWAHLSEHKRQAAFQDEFDRVIASDQPEIDKLKWAFDWISQSILDTAEKEIEIARAMQDQEQKVKMQIKMQTIKSAREILHDCYTRITGRRA
jgi:restriction endonuclease